MELTNMEAGRTEPMPMNPPQAALVPAKEADTELIEAMGIVELMVKQRYLQDMAGSRVLEPQAETGLEAANCRIRLFRVDCMTYEKGVDVLERMGCVFSAVAMYPVSAVYILRFDGSRVTLYMGVDCDDTDNLSMAYGTFKGAFDGNFNGCDCTRLTDEENKALLEEVFSCDDLQNMSVACISGTVADAQKEDDVRKQGLERVIDGMRGACFDLVILADAVKDREVAEMRGGFETLYSQISPFKEQVRSMAHSDTGSFSKSLGKSITDTVTETTGTSANSNTSWSKTKNKGSSSTKQSGKNRAITIGSTILAVGGAIALTAAGAPAAGAALGKTALSGAQLAGAMTSGMFVSSAMERVVGAVVNNPQGSDNHGESSTDSGSEGTGSHHDTGNSHAVSDSQTFTDTTGYSLTDTVQMTFKNRAVESILETIDQRINQLKQCEGGGAFSCSAYVLAADNSVANRAANLYKSVLTGMNEKESRLNIAIWDQSEDMKHICGSLKNLRHPQICLEDYPEQFACVSPCTMVSARNMARHFMLPRRHLTGLTVTERVPFARDVRISDTGKPLHLGNLYNMGIEEKDVPIVLDMMSLSMHTFVTGTTGVGKSTLVYNLLAELREKGVKFMVVEPVKGDYKKEFGNFSDVHVYGTNAEHMPLLRLNPFRFPRGIHVLEHLGGLIEILCVCWPLYAAMPAVLKDAMIRAYEAAGWDMKRSKNRLGHAIYPTFADVMEQVNIVMEESKYAGENKSNYEGALCTRLKALTEGLEGMIFTSNDLTDEELFDENVIIDLSRIDNGEFKQLIMAMLVFKLRQYRRSTAQEANQPLRHVTVLEEAHNLMRKSTVQQSGESSNISGKSVEMLSNAIAEIRSYGEGFIIADQAPDELDKSVIRNTNTKIVMRLQEDIDRELTGKAMGLKEEQIGELTRLENYVAAVYQNDWVEPVLVKLPRFTRGAGQYRHQADEMDGYEFESDKALRNAFISGSLSAWSNELEMPALDAFLRSEASTELKRLILEYRRSSDANERMRIFPAAAYAYFNPGECMKRMKAANSADLWRRQMLRHLKLDRVPAGKKDLDFLLMHLIYEQKERDEQYIGVYNLFMDYIRETYPIER